MRRRATHVFPAAALALGFWGTSLGGEKAPATQADIRDIRGPLEPERSASLLLAGGLIVTGAVLWRASRRTGIDAPSPQEPSDRDPVILLGEILERLTLGEITPSQAVTAAAELARCTLTERTGVDASRLTTGELLAAADRLPSEALTSLALLLSLADRVKFAAHEPTDAEVAAALRSAQTLTGALSGGGAP